MTNSAASVIDVLRERIGVRKAILNSVYGYTARQTLVDTSVRGRDLRREEVNGVLSEAAQQSRWSGVLATTTNPLVSSDIVGDPHFAIVDLSLTKVIDGDLCAVYSWYDNEFGFTNMLLAHVVEAARSLHATATNP
jgi:glyceraldehyde-3-phosphate dehydrogenase/erythrose-4-phosphate dehydrogenase